MKDKVVVGIVGSKFAANFHARSYLQVSGIPVELRAATSRNPQNARTFAEKYNIPIVYETFDEMLADDDIDVVDLCIPNNLHAPYTIQAAGAGKHVVCEKILTGYYGQDLGETKEPLGDTVPRKQMLEVALKSADDMIEACRKSGVKLLYAENWVYMPGIQKARRLVEASGGTILHILGEESHHGSAADYYGIWRLSGGGSLVGKACHPLGAALYLKQAEGLRRFGKPIRPRSVLAHVKKLTKIPNFLKEERKWIRADYLDIEDWGIMIVTFEDGTVATILASEIVVGGIQDRLEVYLSNARINCRISLNNSLVTCAPEPDIFGDEYLMEKLETKAGWNYVQSDEDWANGNPQEIQDFIECIACDREPLSGGILGRDTVALIYSAYLSAEQGGEVEIPMDS